jgi:hypothetical protein
MLRTLKIEDSCFLGLFRSYLPWKRSEGKIAEMPILTL